MIIDLKEHKAEECRLCGGKGSELASLIAAGLPVPSGFVITTNAFNTFVEQSGLNIELSKILNDTTSTNIEILESKIKPLQEHICSSALPQKVSQQLREHLEGQPGASERWAVRSSAVAEDTTGASFAGQYDTILGVSGFEEISTAVLRCWASFLNPHALLYRKSTGISDWQAAVVVQHLIPAATAGVCFTADPVTGDPDRIVINANFGLGESVVSGRATPDTFVVKKSDLSIVSKTIGSKKIMTVLSTDGSTERSVDNALRDQPSLSDKNVLAVADLARCVEKKENKAVDIEWAIADGRVYLLQSRPITTLKKVEGDDIEPPPKGWEPEQNSTIDPNFPLYSNGNISEVLPGCITPLSWSYIGHMIDYSFRAQLRSLGAIKGPIDYSDGLKALGFFYHRPYLCISYFTEIACNTPGMTPDLYYEEFIGPPEKRTSPFALKDLLPNRLLILGRMGIVASWYLFRMKHFAERSTRIVMQDEVASTSEKLKNWTDRELINGIMVTEKYAWSSVIHIWASAFATAGFAVARKLTEQWLGDQGGTTAASLVTGIGVLPSAEPAFGLYDLSRMAASNKTLSELFENQDNKALYTHLIQSDQTEAKKFIQEINNFLSVHGHRGVCEAEFRNPCWREDPSQVIAMIRNYLRPGVTPPSEIQNRQKKARIKATKQTLNSLPLFKRIVLRTTLNTAKRYLGMREMLKNLIELRADRARRIYNELKGRLVDKGTLANPDDIYFLIYQEVRDLVHGHMTVSEAKKIISRRRQDFQWSKQIHLPKIIEGQIKPIDAREVSQDRRLSGTGVYPGKIEGNARVILDPRTDSRVEPGEILVAPVTDAGWTPLFINAAGLVVEVGGLLSHGSIVAREYGLPTVVGAENATTMIKTGDRILVDGAAGLVAIL